MFRTMSGFKGQYHYLTLLVVQEFNEWRVLLYGPNTTIQGTHQFSETKAKEHALAVAQSYIRDQKHESLPDLADVTWEPTTPDDWLVWR
ncbi:MAG TPA: hypothetical protein VMJ75_14495 [Candidatus Acidoferrales bacterium]|nr:hypothetical protein [Candidatus Acidoferrales bacterium]